MSEPVQETYTHPGYEADASYTQDEFTAEAVKAEADNGSTLEQQRKDEAEAKGVQDARHIGYAEVLAVYNAREDTEPLADRRARHLAVDPADQDFTRAVGYTGNSETAETSRTEGAPAEAPDEPPTGT